MRSPLLLCVLLVPACSPFSYGWTDSGDLAWSPPPMTEEAIVDARDNSFGGYLPSATPWLRNNSGQALDCRTADELLSVDAGESLEVDSAPCGVQGQEQRFDVVCHAAGGDPAGEALGNASWFYVCD